VTSATANQITTAALNAGIDPNLAIQVANAESGGNQYNSSGGVLTSSTGAQGIFQLEPSTAAGLGVDATDPVQNIQGGVNYLAQMLNQFGGDVPTALAAYNWGPGNVASQGAAAAPASTQTYVSSILNAIGYSGGSGFGLDSTAGSGFGLDSTADDSLPSWVEPVAFIAGVAVLALAIL